MKKIIAVIFLIFVSCGKNKEELAKKEKLEIEAYNLRNKESEKQKPKEQQLGNSSLNATMYYVMINQFRDSLKMKQQFDKYISEGIEVKHIRSPQSKLYYIYFDRYSNPKDAEKHQIKVNGSGLNFSRSKKNVVWVEKITDQNLAWTGNKTIE